jgi:cobalt-precorrin-5B (C1)-methyltransferase
MILVFGGTTEGRKTVEVLEAAGKPFYYSTKTGEQALVLHHGVAIDGAKDDDAIRQFCLENDIRLLIDAAHPFASTLHSTVVKVAESLNLPVIRYDRIYPPRDPDILWIDDYSQVPTDIHSLLATTGAQSISKLKPLEAKGIKVFYRILRRESSIQLARAQGTDEDRLCYYEDGHTIDVDAEAILLKESGESGGFNEKVKAAREKGMKIIALKRPPVHFPLDLGRLTLQDFSIFNFQLVNGPFGLRRAVEQHIPNFFPLKSGLTTGTCATAAVKAAVLALQGEEEEAVWVQLPNGESVLVDIECVGTGEATVVKDFSDDPDVTRGCRITARVVPSPVYGCGIRFLQGEGVGRVTLPGLGIPVGEPAINPVPRQMITAAVRKFTEEDLDITLSVENGRELAKRTFNERVGVVDGISIIGTSGIVAPLSNDAFIESIGRELQVARAIGCDSIGLASGKRGEEALLALEPELRVIHYGNFIGATLQKASSLGFRRAVLGIMIGKAVKLAEGHLDTHSHKVTMNKDFLSQIATAAGVPDAAAKIEGVTMARELWDLMPPAFFKQIQALCFHHCRSVFPTGLLEIQLVKNE